jgi:hypothetical protein
VYVCIWAYLHCEIRAFQKCLLSEVEVLGATQPQHCIEHFDHLDPSLYIHVYVSVVLYLYVCMYVIIYIQYMFLFVWYCTYTCMYVCMYVYMVASFIFKNITERPFLGCTESGIGIGRKSPKARRAGPHCVGLGRPSTPCTYGRLRWAEPHRTWSVPGRKKHAVYIQNVCMHVYVCMYVCSVP